MRRDRRGFTLIEVLIALSLAGLVVSVAGRVAVQALRTEKRIHELVASHVKTGRVFESIAADMAGRLEGSVKLSLDANHRPMIEIDCLAPYPSQALHVPRLPSTVTYRLVRGHTGNRSLRIKRVVKNLTRPGGQLAETTIARDITEFGVTVFQRGRWEPLSAKLAARLRTPEAFRVTYRLAGVDKAVSRTFLIEPPSLKEKHRAGR